MQNFKQLSKAEMKKVLGGTREFPPCTTDARACNIAFPIDHPGWQPGEGTYGTCGSLGGGGCGCISPYYGSSQSGDCYAE